MFPVSNFSRIGRVRTRRKPAGKLSTPWPEAPVFDDERSSSDSLPNTVTPKNARAPVTNPTTPDRIPSGEKGAPFSAAPSHLQEEGKEGNVTVSLQYWPPESESDKSRRPSQSFLAKDDLMDRPTRAWFPLANPPCSVSTGDQVPRVKDINTILT